MSRWQYGEWAMAAVVIEEDGDIYPLSELSSRHSLKINGFYEERGWFASQFYKLDDLAGSMGTRYEGSFDIHAHIQVTDGAGKMNTLHALCEGYTCCGRDCFMLLIITPGKDAASTTIDFQAVDESEIKEAVGEATFNDWVSKYGASGLTYLDGPLFNIDSTK